MKELKYLNKYLIKYKWHLILGTLFVIISNIFQIVPGPLVRLSIDLVVDNIRRLQDLFRNGAGGRFLQGFRFWYPDLRWA